LKFILALFDPLIGFSSIVDIVCRGKGTDSDDSTQYPVPEVIVRTLNELYLIYKAAIEFLQHSIQELQGTKGVSPIGSGYSEVENEMKITKFLLDTLC